MVLETALTHHLMQGLDIDDPRTTQLRRQMIREKSFLRQVYQEWYAAIGEVLPAGEKPVLELGFSIVRASARYWMDRDCHLRTRPCMAL